MFTVIVPTHDRPVLLARTLRSLAAQTYPHFQVIVVDDSAKYIPPYQELAALQGRYTYVIRSGDSGPAHSRNKAMALADSPYVMFLDDDDTLAPDHLQAMANRIQGSNPALLFCDFMVHNEDRTQSPPQHLFSSVVSIADVDKDSVFVRNRIPNSCLMYRRDVLAGITYDTDMLIYEDWDFLLACLRQHDLQHVPIHSVNIHKSQATAPENMRRGNTRDDKIGEVMLLLYKRHPAPDAQTRQARQDLMASAGIAVPLENC